MCGGVMVSREGFRHRPGCTSSVRATLPLVAAALLLGWRLAALCWHRTNTHQALLYHRLRVEEEESLFESAPETVLRRATDREQRITEERVARMAENRAEMEREDEADMLEVIPHPKPLTLNHKP